MFGEHFFLHFTSLITSFKETSEYPDTVYTCAIDRKFHEFPRYINEFKQFLHDKVLKIFGIRNVAIITESVNFKLGEY